ncbi:MAG: anaerobic ribonucleoside-triphosphate reductase activating protein, partial [Candidatus Parcubacteria bacterium]|nr:anaerobic ribonucleoside-triphosphate reductase activating protein [Candidatus Parcubacteria bacterium]
MSIKIGGLQKLTLLDYPGKIAANIFLAGCNFRCGFCHNPDLVIIKPEANFITASEVLDFLHKRKGVLEGVCIGGGEPLLQPSLKGFLRQIKDLGYLVKLDTNGFNYDFLKDLLDNKLVDYIAMDIKASFSQYEKVTGLKSDFKTIKQSIEL